jgi:hypothetical protein
MTETYHILGHIKNERGANILAPFILLAHSQGPSIHGCHCEKIAEKILEKDM